MGWLLGFDGGGVGTGLPDALEMASKWPSKWPQSLLGLFVSRGLWPMEKPEAVYSDWFEPCRERFVAGGGISVRCLGWNITDKSVRWTQRSIGWAVGLNS